MLLHPESLHVILLGLVPQLIQAYPGHVRSCNPRKHPRTMRIKEAVMCFFRKIERTNQGTINSEWYKLSWQSDSDMPKTKTLSGYLIEAEKKDNVSTGKKQAHKMRSVLLIVLLYLVKECSTTQRYHWPDNSLQICEDM